MGRTGTIYFWREFHPTRGWLSNWYESPFHTGDGKTVYQNAEQYMMHHKALLFEDQEIADMIMEEKRQRKVQTLGRSVKGFTQEKWEANRERIVEEAVYFKFKYSLLKGEDLKEKLLGTNNKELVEASPADRIWGVGFKEDAAEANRASWGLNLLGKVTTNVRNRLREEEKAGGAESSQL